MLQDVFCADLFQEAWQMKPTVQVLMFVVVITSLSASAAWPQDKQWLQYRSVSEATQIVGDLGHQFLKPSSRQPEGIKLPQLQSGQPLSLEWQTPMAASGTVWMAFDKSNPNGEFDRLYLDANANGDLSDDPVCEAHQRDGGSSRFGPAKIVFQAADGPVTYGLCVELLTTPQQTYCLLSPAGWYEGQIMVGGIQKYCMLIDHNVNGAYNDRSPDYGRSDRIRIGEHPGSEASAVGNYIEVDNKLYGIEVARDGTFLIMTEAKDVPYGTVRLNDTLTALVASGENGSFICRVESGVIRLPVRGHQVNS